ncbi:hypothetical protein DUI87_19844 [Hirundo rustica rustica]|uniref:Uncharacterized protein n=1 Tax=Hirundo rustica rustica TaxID=333673 RepID=A0A3M0K6C3_HIRRU|nr:hypothetical protein DUI87_19844 [Hirundo rustica rustica]
MAEEIWGGSQGELKGSRLFGSNGKEPSCCALHLLKDSLLECNGSCKRHARLFRFGLFSTICLTEVTFLTTEHYDANSSDTEIRSGTKQREKRPLDLPEIEGEHPRCRAC